MKLAGSKAIVEQQPLRIPARVRFEWTRQLPLRWFKRYGGDLFTVRDLYRAAVTQSQYHFPEWYLAVHIRKTLGFCSVMKSNHVNDPDKKRLVDRLFASRRRDLRFLRRRDHRAAPPDLLVFDPKNHRILYFAEAKLNRDPLRANQRRYFSLIFKRTKIPTRLFRLRVR